MVMAVMPLGRPVTGAETHVRPSSVVRYSVPPAFGAIHVTLPMESVAGFVCTSSNTGEPRGAPPTINQIGVRFVVSRVLEIVSIALMNRDLAAERACRVRLP